VRVTVMSSPAAVVSRPACYIKLLATLLGSACTTTAAVAAAAAAAAVAAAAAAVTSLFTVAHKY
jgi:hypothetical protein